MAVSVDVLEIGNFADFAERHGSEWQRLANLSDAATVFQTWEWTRSWWDAHKGGKRFRGLVFRDNGVTVGFAAFFRSVVAFPLRSFSFVGTGGSDYLDFVAEVGSESAIASALLAHMQQFRRTWDWIDCQQVRPGAAASKLLAIDAVASVRVNEWRGRDLPIPAPSRGLRRFSQIAQQEASLQCRLLRKVVGESLHSRDSNSNRRNAQRRSRSVFLPPPASLESALDARSVRFKTRACVSRDRRLTAA